MKIRKIQIENLLSFDSITIIFDEKLTVILGPNNSGKTNLVRILKWILWKIQKPVDWGGPEFYITELIRDPEKQFYSTKIDVALDDEELEILRLFFAVYAKQNFDMPQLDFFGIDKNASVKLNEFKNAFKQIFSENAQKLAEIFKNLTIVIEPESIKWTPEFKVIVKHELLGEIQISHSYMWSQRRSPMYNLFREFFILLREKPETKLVNNLSSLDVLNLINAFICGKILELPKLEINVINLLQEILSKGAIITPRVNISEERDKDLIALTQKLKKLWPEVSSGYSFDLLRILLEIFAWKLAILEEFRPQMRESTSIVQLAKTIKKNPKIILRNSLPLFLYKLLRSVNQQDLTMLRKITDMFCELLKEYEFEGFHLITTLERVNSIEPDTTASDIKEHIGILVKWRNRWLPLEFVGAGIFETLVLLSLANSVHKGVLILDEPALHLHPSLQTRLISMLHRKTNNQLIVITHSPYMLLPELAGNIIRFWMEKDTTGVVILQPSNKIKELLVRDDDLRRALFSRFVIVAEGVDEYLIAKILIGHKTNDISVVLGGGSMLKRYCEILNDFKVSYIIFCDGDMEKRLIRKFPADIIVAHKYHDTENLLESLANFLEKKEPKVAMLVRKFYKNKDLHAFRELMMKEEYRNLAFQFKDFKEWIEALLTKVCR